MEFRTLSVYRKCSLSFQVPYTFTVEKSENRKLKEMFKNSPIIPLARVITTVIKLIGTYFASTFSRNINKSM